MQNQYPLPPGYRLVAVPTAQMSGALPLPPMPPPQPMLQQYLVPVSAPPPPYGGQYAHPAHVNPMPPPPTYMYSHQQPGPPPQYAYPSYPAPAPAPSLIASHFRPLPVPFHAMPPPPPPVVQPHPPPPDPQLQRPVFDFAHAPGSLYHQRFQSIATQAADEASREGTLGFSMTGDNFVPYWIRVHKDLLLCHEQRHLPPIWKIKLWGTNIEPFDERTHPARFMVITGLGQVFSFQADTFEDAIVWRAALNAAAGNKPPPEVSVRPPAPAAAPAVAPALQAYTAAPTEHKSPPPKVAAQEAPASTLSRRSTGIGGFFSALFESDDGKWVREVAAQKEPKRFVFEQLRQAMANPNHTLGRPVESFSAKLNSSAALTEEEFTRVVREILDFIRDSITFIQKTYPDIVATAGWEEVAHRATEVAVMAKVHGRVAKLYEWKYRAENERHSAKNKEFLTVTPAHINIPKLFWLSHAEDTEPSEAELARWVPPYFDAIEHMKQLPTLKSASLKLDCLVEVGKRAMACVTKFWEGRIDPAKLIVGADDLLPIMTYITIKARIPNLYSEAMLMQDLMTEQAAMEIGGYSLATLQTCLSHLMVLERREALQAGEEQLRAKRQLGPIAPDAASDAAGLTSPRAEAPPAPAQSPPPQAPAQTLPVVVAEDAPAPSPVESAAEAPKAHPQLPVVLATPPASPSPLIASAATSSSSVASPASSVDATQTPSAEPIPTLPPPPGDTSPAPVRTEDQDLMKFM